MKSILFVLSLITLTIPAHARYECIGKEVRQHGSIPADAKLTFDLYCLNRPKCILNNLVGTVIAGGTRNSDPDSVYRGEFRIKRLVNDLNYKPNKYKGAKIYRKVNAYKTSGSESGMWGDLIISTSTSSRYDLDAHYVFQAGDHMGGTIHMRCNRFNTSDR